MEKIKIGISSCLLGQKVRYDGGHKLDGFLSDTLGQHFNVIPICPETECGLGIPRETMRLTGKRDAPRLVTRHSREDKTEIIVRWAQRRILRKDMADLGGFIFKSRSPSCGMEKVKIYNARGALQGTGAGIFAGMIMKRFPLLPVEDEGRLRDEGGLGNFVERIFTLRRWRETRKAGPGRGALVAFHSRHKFLLLSHSPKLYRTMEKLVASPKDIGRPELFHQYEILLAEALRLRTTPKKNAAVLKRMMGYFKKRLSADEKRELQEAMDNYQRGHLPLTAPITLLSRHARKYDPSGLADQIYLNPHPLEVQLRSEV